MVELRWAIPSSTTVERPRLQFRHCPDVIQFGAGSGWSDWADVPFVVVPQAPPKPAPTLAHVFGVTEAPAPSTSRKACKSDPSKECVFGPCYFGGPCHAEAERSAGVGVRDGS